MRSGSIIAIFFVLLLLGCTSRDASTVSERTPTSGPKGASTSSFSVAVEQQRSMFVDFSQFHPSFRFTADIPAAWKVEFAPEILALNIFDPMTEAETKSERSQIFIRSFEANAFLTLSTVNILSREVTTVGSHDAVRYEIEKKAGVAPFRHQPSWRSGRHQLIDVRLTAANPSLFYVFASHPSLDSVMFENFLQSLRFHNDRDSYRPPLSQAQERITKKPFGLEVTPSSSPVQPERFKGFHTGSDFEMLSGEESADVTINAICGGAIRSKNRAEGYGGVIVQECLLQDEVITVIYGHLALQSVINPVGGYLAPGARIGLLGAAGTEETNGERKHLHLGVHKGKAVNISGYVQSTEQLSAWMDPAELLWPRQ